MSSLTRRNFIKSSAAMTAAVGASQAHPSLGARPVEANVADNVIVFVHLRGGADFLNLIVPISGSDRAHYEAARPSIAIDADDALQLGTTAFGLHPNATELHNLYAAGNLAIVQATGIDVDSRSHEEVTAYMHNGTPGTLSTTTGWLTRMLDSDPNLPDTILMPGASINDRPSPAFRGSNEIFTADEDSSFRDLLMLNGFFYQRAAQRNALREIYAQDTSSVHVAGMQALNAANMIELFTSQNAYEPPDGMAVSYSDAHINERFERAAQLIKLELGIRAITIEHDQWDYHEGQGTTSGSFWNRVGELSQGLAAFYADMVASGGDYANRVTVVVMSEFGRKLRQNDDGGCGHGHGGAMLVIGGAVNGGLYGTWPGLDYDALYQGSDVAITTDYRQVLSEILIRHMGNPKLGQIFPGYTGYTPLGVVQGTDLTPEYDERVPTAVGLDSAETSPTSNHILTAASVGVAATAGLVALRSRGAQDAQNP